MRVRGFLFHGVTSYLCVCQSLLPHLASSPFLKISIFCVLFFCDRGFSQIWLMLMMGGSEELTGSSVSMDTACQRLGFSAFLLGPSCQCLWVFWGAICYREILLLLSEAAWLSGEVGEVGLGSQVSVFSVPSVHSSSSSAAAGFIQVGERIYATLLLIQTSYQCSQFLSLPGVWWQTSLIFLF